MKFIGEKFGQLTSADFVKAFWMFLLTTVTSIVGDAILQAFQSGDYALSAIHWKPIGAAIVVATISYIQKQIFSNSEGKVFKKEPVKVEAPQGNA